jgi:hypothetical protein
MDKGRLSSIINATEILRSQAYKKGNTPGVSRDVSLISL